MQARKEKKTFYKKQDKEVTLDPRLQLYQKAKNSQQWKNLVYKKLEETASNAVSSHPRLNKYRWDAMIAYYHVDMLNFPNLYKQIYAGLVNFTCTKTGLSTEEVQKIFVSSENKIALDDEKVVPPLLVSDTKDSQVKRVSCGSISYKISAKTWDNLHNDPLFLTTFLNYSFLNPESGLFWSIAREVYDALQNSAVGMHVLECFASPFNYNLKSFCSAFRDDAGLKYPPGVRCYGDFFSYIEALKTDYVDPVRLIVNPPYTDRLIDLVAEKVISYLQVQPNAEFIAMLPDWTPQEGITRLETLPGSVSYRFAPQEFYLYDSIHQKAIKPPGMRILIIVNLGGDLEASTEKLEELKQIITQTALRTQ